MMSRIPVYFMPGLAAGPAIFERIALDPERYEMHFLEWQMPIGDERLSDYARRLSQKVTAEHPVLVGVSFGGILVQEMAAFLNPQKVIIISSVRSNADFPRRMKITKALKAYKLFPSNLPDKMERLAGFSFGPKIKQRLELYRKFIAVREDAYLKWAIKNVVLWNRTQIDPQVVHIHGTADEVFPYRYITQSIPVQDGTHIMILNRFKWFNENLPKIISESARKDEAFL